MVKYGIGYISAKNSPIATKRKANKSIWTLGLKSDSGFDLGHDLDIWIFKVICDLDHLVTKVRCKDLPDSDRGDFRCRRAVDSSSFDEIFICALEVVNLTSCCAANDENFIKMNTFAIQGTASQCKRLSVSHCRHFTGDIEKWVPANESN